MLRNMISAFLLAGSLLVVIKASVVIVENGPLNTRRWGSVSTPTGNQVTINVVYDSSYGNDEGLLLTASADAISTQLGGCIRFNFLTAPPAGQPFVMIRPRLADPTRTTDRCNTYNGYFFPSGNNGQAMIMFGSRSGTGIGGCLDNLRDAMRLWANVLGLLDEWRRSDRGSFMTFAANRNARVDPRLQQYNLFEDINMWTAQQAQTKSNFDVSSITMISGERFAANPAQPVFTLPAGVTVPTSARLSKDDCDSIKLLYGCPVTAPTPLNGPPPAFPTCASLSSSGGSVQLNPNPAVLTRSIQCATTTSLLNENRVLGFFWVSGIRPQATDAAPTVTLTPAISGVTADVVRLAGATGKTGPTLTATASALDFALCTGPDLTNCYYAIRLRQTQQLARGILNAQATVNLQFASTGTQVAQAYSMPLTINLNCAPQFTSVSVKVGPAAYMTSMITQTIGSGIDVGPAIPPTKPAAADAISINPAAATDPSLESYLVHYRARAFGQTGTVAANDNIAKVWLSCTGGTLAAGGSSVIGSLTATDPDGGPVHFVSITGSPATAADAGGGELIEITREGVIVTNTYAAKAALKEGAVAPDAANAKSYFVTAVDALGGQSMIKLDFFFACAQTPLAAGSLTAPA